MPSGVGRIAPFLAASVALHGAALVITAPERLSIAPAPAGTSRTVAVRLVAAGAPAPKSAQQNAERSAADRRLDQPEPRVRTDEGKVSARTTSTVENPAPPRPEQRHRATQAARTDERANDSAPAQPSTPALAHTAKAARRPTPTAESEPAPERPFASAPENPSEARHPQRAPVRPALARADSENPPKADPSSAGEDGTAATSTRARRARTEVATRLARYFHYPRLARRQGWQGRVVLSFRITPGGRVRDIRVTHSSGYAILDQAAIRALQQVGRIPALARPKLDESLTLRIPIVYRLRAAHAGRGPGYA